MDIKKSTDADLESKRTTRFLLGLIVVLASFFVAFEYTNRDETADIDDSMLDELLQDVEMIPVTVQQSRMAPPPSEQPSLAAKLKIVDNQTAADQAEEQDRSMEQSLETDGQAETTADEQTPALDPMATGMQENPLNFHVVEDLPQFPGGAGEFMKWLTKNLRYPVDAERQKIQGKVVVQFIVSKDGTVGNIEIVKSLDPSCDRETLRVLRMMPKWKAGIQDGKPCRTKVCIPIVFRL